MFDKSLVGEILQNISWSIERIFLRSEKIFNYEQFLDDENGLEKLDSICMQLINIGEALKQIDKITDYSLLKRYDEVGWNLDWRTNCQIIVII